MASTQRRQIEAILAGARAEHAALLGQLSPALRASLPVDATGVTQAIDHLAAALGVSDDLRAEQEHGHQANPAVLHGRVFGRAPLARATVLAAFAAGARVRAEALGRLARAAGGPSLAAEVGALLAAHASQLDTDDESAVASLREEYSAHEEAVVRIADHLDALTAR